MEGSPPRARGRPAGAWLEAAQQGLTPACAGTSPPTARNSANSRAHPRVRGDVDVGACHGRFRVGSPPRARGRLGSLGMAGPLRGLTPACAGTSHSQSRCSQWTWAHPRVRGAVPYRRPQAPDRRGLTPACAGTSLSQRARPAASGAHPRVRGDVDRLDDLTVQLTGSPPRARGRRPRLGRHRPERGLTPACAGTSGRAGPGAAPSGAHPRVRGDVPRAGRPDCRSLGLTPACAGTSKHQAGCVRGIGAHPRVRGDVTGSKSSIWRISGSPPRARGRRNGRAQPRQPSRAHPRVRGDVRTAPT